MVRAGADDGTRRVERYRRAHAHALGARVVIRPAVGDSAAPARPCAMSVQVGALLPAAASLGNPPVAVVGRRPRAPHHPLACSVRQGGLRTHHDAVGRGGVGADGASEARRRRSGTAGCSRATRTPPEPRPRITFGKWCTAAEKLGEDAELRGRGYHSLRRQFATELKDTPLHDLAYLGGWKDTSTLLKCYQQPDEGDPTTGARVAPEVEGWRAGLVEILAQRTPATVTRRPTAENAKPRLTG